MQGCVRQYRSRSVFENLLPRDSQILPLSLKIVTIHSRFLFRLFPTHCRISRAAITGPQPRCAGSSFSLDAQSDFFRIVSRSPPHVTIRTFEGRAPADQPFDTGSNPSINRCPIPFGKEGLPLRIGSRIRKETVPFYVPCGDVRIPGRKGPRPRDVLFDPFARRESMATAVSQPRRTSTRACASRSDRDASRRARNVSKGWTASLAPLVAVRHAKGTGGKASC